MTERLESDSETGTRAQADSSQLGGFSIMEPRTDVLPATTMALASGSVTARWRLRLPVLIVLCP